ncbi:MAG: nucleotidyltransferase domain-containing protein, partial [Desulfobacterales bacterium]
MQATLSHTEIMNILKNDMPFLKKEFGVINIGLFGSYAKGIQKTDSDIDLLVKLNESRFEWLAGLQLYLEARFGRKIELVRKADEGHGLGADGGGVVAEQRFERRPPVQ